MKNLFFIVIFILTSSVFAQYEIQTENLTDVEEHKVVVVKKGDTLWELCEQNMGDPFLWPKIWALNPEIENPHIIEPGDKVHFYPRSGKIEIESQDGIKTKNISLGVNVDGESGNGNGSGIQIASSGVSSGNSESSAGSSILARYESVVSSAKFKSSGIVESSNEEHILLSTSDSVYLKFDNLTKVNQGDIYNVYKIREKLIHPLNKKSFGYIVDILGEVEITGKTKTHGIGKIIAAYTEIERGTYVLPKIDLGFDIEATQSTKKIDANIIDFAKEVDNVGSNELVFIDKGKKVGIEKGMILKIVRDVDPISKKKTPIHEIGEVVIISTSLNTSTGYVVTSILELNVGDKVTTTPTTAK